MSDKLEPFIIICVISPLHGRLHRLTLSQIAYLKEVIMEFKAKFGINNETYHYTPLEEREETDRFVYSGGATSKSKSHSSHFHLKMRISSAMYKDVVKILHFIDLNRARYEIEPVGHSFTRATNTYRETMMLITKDASDKMDNDVY